MATTPDNSFRPTLEILKDRLVRSTVELTSAGVLQIVGTDAGDTIRVHQGNGVISIEGLHGGVRQSAVKLHHGR